MLVERYSSDSRAEWDEFVRTSKNGTFLFLRDYMDYHRERFQDYSLVIRDDRGALVSILPAHAIEERLVSHAGLTYGGFVTNSQMTTVQMLEVFDAVRCFLDRSGFRVVVYKAIPYIYQQLPSGEDLYCLYRYGAALFRRDLSSAAVPGAPRQLQQRRIRGRKKALAAGIQLTVTERYEEFWPVLEWNLHTAHGIKPVHTLAEMQLLANRFPENIRLHCATLHGEIVAGCVIFETATTAHAQYTASSAVGRSSGALDLLFTTLLDSDYAHKAFFNFGVSSEDEGRHLNDGLVEFKEGFGARAVVHDFYEMPVRG